MSNTLTTKQAIELSKQLKKQNKKIVLAGGCFDILHPGHLKLLENAKSKGDVLFVVLESDKKIVELKGQDRPLHTQQERAAMLTALRFVDYVILLPYFSENQEYDSLIEHLRPDTIATTEHDPNIEHKRRQAERIGGNVLEVTKFIPHKSTTRLLKILSEEQ